MFQKFFVAAFVLIQYCIGFKMTRWVTSSRIQVAMTRSEPQSQRENARSLSVNQGIAFATLLVGTVSVRRANAGFFSSAEQDAVNEIASYQKPVFELLEALRPADVPNTVGVYASTTVLKGSKEDADVVTTYLYTYINPLQKIMEGIASKLQLPATDDQTRLEVLPSLMKGHIIELQQAIKELKFEAQAREVEEIQETLGEFLKLASTKYTIQSFTPTRPLSDSELFGPLGCEFWGKKRVPGSNACADKNDS